MRSCDGSARSRRPDGVDAALLGAALLAATLALALAALTGTHWWPTSAPPTGCLPVLTCS